MNTIILVVEDNPENLELMTYLLNYHGYKVLIAEDGKKALEIMSAKLPDMILCDIQLPIINGYEIAREVKSTPEFKHIPLIAVTAYSMGGDKEKILASGYDGYISKPISPETFVKQIEKYLVPVKRL